MDSRTKNFKKYLVVILDNLHVLIISYLFKKLIITNPLFILELPVNYVNKHFAYF